jgi:hypothetical protein
MAEKACIINSRKRGEKQQKYRARIEENNKGYQSGAM